MYVLCVCLEIERMHKNALYQDWSTWSACKKCRKVRVKKCISQKCKDSILYEVRPCNIARCRRKNRTKKKINIIQVTQIYT